MSDFQDWDRELVAAGQTDEPVGLTDGNKGDYIARIILIPTTTAPGAVDIKDGSGGAERIYHGGTWNADLAPKPCELGIKSSDGAWQITTGINITVMVVGRLT